MGWLVGAGLLREQRKLHCKLLISFQRLNETQMRRVDKRSNICIIREICKRSRSVCVGRLVVEEFCHML